MNIGKMETSKKIILASYISAICKLIYSPMCHKSIWKAIDSLSEKHVLPTTWIRVNSCGEIDLGDLEFQLKRSRLNTLVSKLRK